MQINATRRVAGLPGDVAEVHPAHDPLADLCRRRVGTGDQRVLAAKLERQRLQGCTRCLHHRASCDDAADEADLRDAWMLGERRAGIASAGDDVEHARREHAIPQLRDAQRRQWRLLGRLDDQRIARGKRGGRLAGDEQQRMIERADPRDDAERLTNRVVEHAGRDRNRRPFDFGDEPGKVIHVGRADIDVVAHRLQRVAGVDRVDPRELFAMRAQDRRCVPDALRARPARAYHATPRTRTPPPSRRALRRRRRRRSRSPGSRRSPGPRSR